MKTEQTPALNLALSTATLDADWLALPNEIMVWNTAFADATQECQMLENKRVVLKAQAERKIRQTPSDYGFQKVTEDLVKSTVAIQPEVVAIEDACVQAKHSCNVTKAIIEALDVKRSSLKYLSELTLVGYTGSAAVPAGIKK